MKSGNIIRISCDIKFRTINIDAGIRFVERACCKFTVELFEDIPESSWKQFGALLCKSDK